METKIRFHFFSSPHPLLDTLFDRFPAARAMGACCAGLPTVKPEDIVPDPTEPSTFFLSKQSLLSSNYKVRVRCPVSRGLCGNHQPSAPKHVAKTQQGLNETLTTSYSRAQQPSSGHRLKGLCPAYCTILLYARSVGDGCGGWGWEGWASRWRALVGWEPWRGRRALDGHLQGRLLPNPPVASPA